MHDRRAGIGKTVVFALFLVQLSAMLVLSYFPEWRVWGLSTWTYLAHETRIVLFLCGAAIAVVTSLRWRRVETLLASLAAPVRWRRGDVLVAGTMLGGLWLLYAVARQETFLLGDGHEVVDYLATGGEAKLHEFGAVWIHRLAYELAGSNGFESARKAVQVSSTIAGSLAVIACLLVGQRVMPSRGAGVVLAVGLLLGGYSLQFIGYIENYAFFIFFVLLFTLWGLFSIEEPSKRWWLIPVTGGALLMHVLGVALLPALLFVVLAPTSLGRRITELSGVSKLVGMVLVGGLTVTVLHVLAADNFFIYYTLVPLEAQPFTPGDYSLLSGAHVLDIANLLLLIAPPLTLFLGLFAVDRRRYVNSHDARHLFLLVALVSTLGAVFLLDPKLGMARDWDLFSFVGVPAMGLVLWGLLEHRQSDVVRQTIVLSIVLCLLSLAPRIATLASESRSIEQFRDYAMLDFQKNRKEWFHLVRHYELSGDTAQAETVRTEWSQLYPDRGLVDSARGVNRRGHRDKAVELLMRAADHNPSNADVWANLGDVLYSKGLYDSAIVVLVRALRLSPGRPPARNNLATSYLGLGQYDAAIDHLHRAHELAPENPGILYNLAGAYHTVGNDSLYQVYLRRCVQYRPLVPQAAVELIVEYLKKGDLVRARQTLQQAKAAGLDNQIVENLIEQVPQLESR